MTWALKDLDSWAGALFYAGRAHVTSSDIFDGDVLDVESDLVAWKTFWDLGVVHLDGFDFGGDVGWSECDDYGVITYKLNTLLTRFFHRKRDFSLNFEKTQQQ